MEHALRCETATLLSLFERGNTLNMDGVIYELVQKDKRAVILFLTAEGCNPAAIHWRMVAVYREKYLSKTAVIWRVLFDRMKLLPMH